MDQTQPEYVYPDDYQLFGHVGRTHVIESQIIPAEDDQWSDCVDLAGYRAFGLLIPALEAGTTSLTFWVTDEDCTDYAIAGSLQLTDAAQNAIDINVTAGPGDIALSSDELSCLAGYRFVKLYVDASQTATRTFHWILKG